MWPIIIVVAVVALFASRKKSSGSAPPLSREACYQMLADYYIAHPEITENISVDPSFVNTMAAQQLMVCMETALHAGGSESAALKQCKAQLVNVLFEAIQGPANLGPALEGQLRARGAIKEADCVRALRT